MTTTRSKTPGFDELVEIITVAVLGRLTGDRSVASGEGPRTFTLMWVLGAPCGHLNQLARLMAVLDRTVHLQRIAACPDAAGGLEAAAADATRVCDSIEVVDPVGRPGSVSAVLDSIEKVDLVYAGSLGTGQASALTAVNDADPFVQILLNCLWANKPVYVVEDPSFSGVHRAQGHGGEGLAHALKRNRQDLAAMGIRRVSANELAGPLGELDAERTSFNRATGGLLTETDVRTVASQGIRFIEVAKGTIITPLALERARLTGIEIRKK